MKDFITGIPIIGLLIAIPFFRRRIETEKLEDATYAELMKKMGEVPHFLGHSSKREKQKIVGEILGHLIGIPLILIFMLKFFYADLFLLLASSYAGSYYGGIFGGYIASKSFDFVAERLINDN